MNTISKANKFTTFLLRFIRFTGYLDQSIHVLCKLESLSGENAEVFSTLRRLFLRRVLIPAIQMLPDDRNSKKFNLVEHVEQDIFDGTIKIFSEDWDQLSNYIQQHAQDFHPCVISTQYYISQHGMIATTTKLTQLLNYKILNWNEIL